MHVEATIRQAGDAQELHVGVGVRCQLLGEEECGASKLSNGLDAVLSLEALTQVWAAWHCRRPPSGEQCDGAHIPASEISSHLSWRRPKPNASNAYCASMLGE